MARPLGEGRLEIARDKQSPLRQNRCTPEQVPESHRAAQASSRDLKPPRRQHAMNIEFPPRRHRSRALPRTRAPWEPVATFSSRSCISLDSFCYASAIPERVTVIVGGFTLEMIETRKIFSFFFFFCVPSSLMK